MFVTGRPRSNSRLTCWQVLSIPDGQTTALAWKSGLRGNLNLVAGRYIITQSLASILTFHMGSLQPGHRIDLKQALHQVGDPDAILHPVSLSMWDFGRLIEANDTHMAMQVEGRGGWWVLVFEIRSGRLQGS